MKKRKIPKGAWFIPIRGSYLPASWQGLILYVLFVTYLVAAVFIVAKHNASVLYIAMQVLVQWIVATIIMTWIAQRKS